MPVDVVEASSPVVEGVIAPEMTCLLEIAKAKGRAIHTGAPMLAAQMNLMLRFMGAASFVRSRLPTHHTDIEAHGFHRLSHCRASIDSHDPASKCNELLRQLWLGRGTTVESEK